MHFPPPNDVPRFRPGSRSFYVAMGAAIASLLLAAWSGYAPLGLSVHTSGGAAEPSVQSHTSAPPALNPDPFEKAKREAAIVELPPQF